MNRLLRLGTLGLVALLTASVLSTVAFAATVVVTPTNLDGWTPTMSGGSTLTFENGPATPPLSTGSAEFRVDATGSTAAQLRNGNYVGTLLDDLTELDYYTYVEQNNGGLPGNGGQAVYIILNVDYDGNGSTDDLLFFEPVYQTASFCPTNPQPALALTTWQNWDALDGCWWSLNNTAGAGPGTNTKPLSAIIAVEPDAAIAAGTGPTGAVRLVAGFGGPADWGSFIGNADAFTINGDTYDFELFVVASDKDDCKDGGWMTFVREDGTSFKNQGDCLKYVKAVPTSVGDCKKGGWQTLVREDNTPFKNQGDCESYVRNGK